MIRNCLISRFFQLQSNCFNNMPVTTHNLKIKPCGNLGISILINVRLICLGVICFVTDAFSVVTKNK